MRALLLFDINGTIVARDERTDLPYYEAIDACFNLTNGMAGIDNSARSDQDVFREVLAKHNIAYDDAHWQNFLDVFEQKLDKYQDSDIWRPNVDAVSFIEKLAASPHQLAIVSGELAIAAQYKLEKVGVWQFFQCGGFGDDGLTRLSIAQKALKKAAARFGNGFSNVYIIGDTLLDIATARQLGAKVISITTGANSRAELAQQQPDYLIDRFSELDSLFF